jgi:adenosylhomocysteine nucleosidase
MVREVRPLVRDWPVGEKEYAGRRFRFFEKDETVLACAGIGAEAARRTAEAVIALYQPEVVYSVGFAGALATTRKVGDVIHPARVVNASDGSRVLLENGHGVLVSFPSIASPEQKAKLNNSFGAEAVDMEAAAVARAAELRGIRFAAIKVISDELDFVFPSVERFVDSAGRFSEFRFALYSALRPWLWGRVARLARNSRLASRNLCQVLQDLNASPLPTANRNGTTSAKAR